VNDIEFDAYGNAYAIVGLAGNPANRDNLLQVPDFSQLLAINNFDVGAILLVVAALIFGFIGLTAYWVHLADFSTWKPLLR